MKILFLGTAAGGMWPATFCMCKRCKEARREGRIMTASSVLIDNQYLIDAPSGIGFILASFNVNIKFPFHIFITHSHQDHFSPEEIIAINNDPENNKIHLYINKKTFQLLKYYKKFNRFFNFENSNYINVISPFKALNIDSSLRVIPILASHDNTHKEKSLNYILKIKGRTILYACDTGWYMDRTWKEVEKYKFDIVILECSFLNRKTNGRNHMDFESFLNFVANLRRVNSIGARTQVVATHFSFHHFDGRKIAVLKRHGVEIAYRGMICKC